ncbi:tryptophan transporter [Gardnerella sp. KA00747]|uniref:tryptophan transporter n=1 Tax=Gardnerella sp. KA00747 TaxID=2749078 RepID=UPI003BAA227E
MAQEINETVKETYNNDAKATTDAAAAMMQNVKVKHHALDITSLVLVAVLFAAGCILDFTVAKSLSIGNIQPEFVIASFCLSILLVRPNILQGAIIGALAATLIQFNTSIPGLEYACDIPAAIVMTLMIMAYVRVFPKDAARKFSIFPLIATFITTVVSGLIFASTASFFVLHSPKTILVMLPIIFGTAVFNAVVVEVLYTPIRLVLHK